MNAAQRLIAQRMAGKHLPTESDRQYFQQMLRSGEASSHDLEAVGTWKLAYQVADTFFDANKAVGVSGE